MLFLQIHYNYILNLASSLPDFASCAWGNAAYLCRVIYVFYFYTSWRGSNCTRISLVIPGANKPSTVSVAPNSFPSSPLDLIVNSSSRFISPIKKSLGSKDIEKFYRQYRPKIKGTTINWRIYILIQSVVFSRIGMGKFILDDERNFIRNISSKIEALNKEARFCKHKHPLEISKYEYNTCNRLHFY